LPLRQDLEKDTQQGEGMGLETILVVEDEPDVLGMVSILLECSGYQVLPATSGEAALSVLETTHPDLIISDVVMPGMNGFAFFEQVRADVDQSQIPFIFLTSMDERSDVRLGMGLGADDYLTKPFEPEELLAAVKVRLARATQTRDYREQESREQLERSRQALADRVAELEVLYHIGVAVSSTLETEAILQLIVDLARALVNATSCSVLLPDQETGDLVCHAATEPIVGMRVPAGQGIATCALRQRTPLVIHDTPAEPDPFLQIEQEIGTTPHSLLLVPLLVGDRAIGVLAAVDNRPERFAQQDCDLFLTLASQAATAIENARLYAAEQEQRALAESLRDTAAALNSTLDFDTVLDRILANVGRVVPHDNANVMLIESGTARIVRSRGYDTRGLQGLMPTWRLPIADIPTLRQMAETGQPCAIPDVQRHAGWVDLPDMRWIRSYAGAPIRLDGETIGFLNLDSATPGHLNATHAERLQAFANQAAVAIQNAWLFEQAQQEIAERMRLQERLTAIHRLGEELTLLRDEDVIIQRVLETAAETFPDESIAYGQVEKAVGELVYRYFLFDGVLEEVGLRLPLDGERGIGATVVRHQAALNVLDTMQDPGYLSTMGEQARSELCVPMKVGERIVGVLSVGSIEPHRFTSADQQLLQTLADQAAVALENTRLYKDLQDQMRTLQNTQEQLIHSEKTAALGRLTGSIAHEISNPLQSVLGCLTLAEEELADSQRREEIEHYLGMAGEEIERIAAIVSRMRDFYRPAREERQPTDLHAILESVLALTRKELQHANVSIVREWTGELPMIPANPDHLKQVFLNLVLNAKDAMPQGGTLQVRTALDRMPTGDGQSPLPAVRMEFRDTGVGMSPETQARLFEPFFTTKDQGMGLGLSISYGLIEAHHGQISVKSQEGEGTTFTILLPDTGAPSVALAQS
jgi:two-component system NtrC family sensor kinase